MEQYGSTRFVCLRDIVRVSYLCRSENLIHFIDDYDSVYNYISGIVIEEEDTDGSEDSE